MNFEVVDAFEETNQRIAHACQLCREKRVRCSGQRPTCQRCQQQEVECVYGYAQGDKRKRLLAAIEEHNARGDQTTTWPDHEHPTQMKLKLTNGERAPAGDDDEDDEDHDDGASEGTADTESSLQSPIRPQNEDSISEASSAKRSTRKEHRRSRISSACLECKKRRRKCTGKTPCQTCTTFQVDCVYDRTQDRRSKAYFHKKLNDGVREAMESDNISDVLKLIQKNDHYDQVASELRVALRSAEKSKHQVNQTTDNVPSPMTQYQHPLICTSFCGLGGHQASQPQWVPQGLRNRQVAMLGGPHHLVLPYIVPDDSPLSLAFSNFRDAVTHMVDQGTPITNILGPLDTEVDLLFRVRRADDLFTTGTWACELARIYAHIDIFTQLANAFLLSRFMRWVLDPSEENYILLPGIMKPTKSQRVIPHFASADLYSLPAIRDGLVRGELKLDSAMGKKPLLGLKFEWPFDLDKAVDRFPLTGTAKLSRLFTACASDPSYWSHGEEFLETFPEAKGHLNVITHQHDWDQLASLGD